LLLRTDSITLDPALPTCTGIGLLHQADLKRLIDETKSIAGGAVYAWDDFYVNHHSSTLWAAAAHYGFEFDPSLPVKDYTTAQRDLLFYGVESPRFRRHFPEIEPPSIVRQGRFEGLATNLLRRYAERIEDTGYRDRMGEYLIIQTCPDCGGTRLRPESRAVTVNGQSIVALSRLPLTELASWLSDLPVALNQDERAVAGLILADLDKRIARLVEVGAGYLALERSSPSLSAGEAQRLRLASLLGSGLSGVLYVLDEPTIGIHPRDTQRMIGILRRLRDLGNTVLVIEHDLEMIAASDHVIDFGPGGGVHGGQGLTAGSPPEVAGHHDSLTGGYLSGRVSIPVPVQRRNPDQVAGGAALTVHGARHHNL
jgi:excinuclease ABC subunit A